MPPLAPTSPQLSVDVLLKNPEIIRRRLTDLTLKRFVADKVFMRGSPDQVAGGGARYQRSENIYFDGSGVEQIGFRSEFPRAGWSETVLEAFVKAYGLEFVINDLAKRRNAMDMVERGLIKLSNGIVKFVDTVAMTLLTDTVTNPLQTFAAGGDWTTAATDIIFDLNRARMAIEGQEEGYVADTVLVNDAQFADLMNDADIRASMPRESRDNFVLTGVLPSLLGFQIIRTNRLTAGKVVVMNAKVAGTIADESPLAEEGYGTYQPGDPGQSAIWVKQYREENTSDTLVRGVRWPAMWIAEPAAIVVITGA